MPTLLRVLLPLLIAALAFTACGRTAEPEPEVDVPDPDVYVEEARALLGTWVMTEQAGAMPDRVVTLTFTEDGDYILVSEGLGTQRRQYHAAGPSRIEVTDPSNGDVEHYEYDVTGQTLTLTIPGTEAVTVFERREDLIEHRDDLTPDTVGQGPATVPVPEGPDRPEEDYEPDPDEVIPVPDDPGTDR